MVDGSESEIEPEPSDDAIAAIPSGYRPTARRLGIDTYRVEVDAGTSRRREALAWVCGLFTKSGKRRSERVAQCGTLRVARCGDVYGLDHSWCRDRACPTCMRHKQQREAAQVRRFYEQRQDEENGSAFIFATFTQAKKARSDESASEALDRLLRSFRRMTNKKYAAGREFRSWFSGGLRACETVLSRAGQPNKDGGKVAYTGWHSHIHAILEVAPPSPEAIAKWGLKRAWEHRIECAKARAVGLWLDVSEGARDHAQKMVLCDPNRAGQITKYLTKPFELRAGEARELFLAMKGRRVIEGIGEWRQWRTVEVLDEPRPEIELAPESFADLVTQAENGGWIHFDLPCIGDNGKSFSVSESVPANLILRAIREDPRTFTQRRQDERRVMRRELAMVREVEQMQTAADRYEDEVGGQSIGELRERLERQRKSYERQGRISDALLAADYSP